MDGCIFCEIVAGRAPASVVHEDEIPMVFMDLGAVSPGHLLVVPKRHVVGLDDLDDETGRHLFSVTRRMAAAVRRSGLRCEGINLFVADGEAAFQEVFHLHLHVLPRFRGDSFRIDANWSARPTREELDRVAASIRDALAATETAG